MNLIIAVESIVAFLLFFLAIVFFENSQEKAEEKSYAYSNVLDFLRHLT